MIKKIACVLICLIIIAGGSTEAAGGPVTSVESNDELLPLAAVMLSGSALDPLLKPTVDYKKNAETKSASGIPSAVLEAPASAQRFPAEDLELLARLVQAEAGSESYEGKVAVAATVLNRVNSTRYPGTIPGVIYQREPSYQYCPVRNGTINRPAGKAARKAVQDALRGNDPTGGALSFYNPAIATNAWIRTRPVHTHIGNHVFVR